MTKIGELQIRAERVLAGERNLRDLDALFLWLRLRSYGNKAVADIGNFVGHSDERDQGISWANVRDIAYMIQFHIPRMSAQKAEKPFATTVDELRAVGHATLEVMPAAQVKAEMGFGKSAAKRYLNRALAQVIGIKDGEVELSAQPAENEFKALKRFTSIMVIRPAFSSADLTQQFVKCLAKNGLADERQPTTELESFLAIHAIEKMHLSRVILPSGEKIPLAASVSDVTGALEVVATVLATTSEGPTRHWASFPIFSTSLKAADWCEPGLLELEPAWNFPLEIGSSGKLKVL